MKITVENGSDLYKPTRKWGNVLNFPFDFKIKNNGKRYKSTFWQSVADGNKKPSELDVLEAFMIDADSVDSVTDVVQFMRKDSGGTKSL